MSDVRLDKSGMKVSVIGAGYVGLVVAVCLAKMGNEVIAVDTDKKQIEAINSRVSPIYEPGVNEILSQVNIRATSNYQEIAGSEIIFICVNTPSKEDGSISLESITKATTLITSALKEKKDYYTIVVKSTVVPGTTREVIIPILESSGKKAGKDFGVCMSPEFLREGSGVYDFMNPDRIVIGEFDKKSGDVLCALHRDFDAPTLRVNLQTAEMIKYASNAFLATKLSYMNEIGNICKKLNIDAYEVAQGMCSDERIGSKFLNAGIGFGGPCLPKDIKALISRARQLGYQPKLLEEVDSLNERQGLKMIELLKNHIPLQGKDIGLLGLSFKPGTDDVKGSIAITITNALLEAGATVKAYDPQAMPGFKSLFPQIKYASPQEVLRCDAVLIITEWDEFSQLDYRGTKIVIDGRRVLKAREAPIYEGICW